MSRHSHMYKTRRWQARRKAQLSQEPLCKYCHDLGELTPATVADHITPHNGDTVLFDGPLQSLCKHCHDSTKKAEEARGIRPGAGLDGVPTDSRHHWNS